MEKTQKTKEKKTILRVSKYLFRYKTLFGLTLLFASMMTAFEISVPLAIQYIFDKIQSTQSIDNLVNGIFLISLLYILSELSNCFRIRINNKLEQKVLFEMRSDLHTKLLNLSVSFYDNKKSGEIASRVIEDVATVERALLDGTEQGLGSLLKIIGISLALFYMEPSLAVWVCLPVPILLAIAITYAKKSRKVWRKVRESAGELNSLLIEDIQGNRLIQSFRLQNKEQIRFKERATDLKDKNIKAMYRWSIYSPFTNLITKLGFISIIGFGGYLAFQIDSSLSIGQLIAFFLLANMLYQPISQLHGLNHLLAAGKASGDRVFEILDAKNDINESKNPIKIKNETSSIEFRNVCFKYPGRTELINDLNLEIEKNKVTALVGHTGAGKSTIANLAMRTYDCTKGEIIFSGTNIKDLSFDSLNRNLGFVAQDPFLFDGTIRDNLLIAKNNATNEDINKAIKEASAFDFINSLPDGIDTNIGEKGIRLSQGEKQRITIARVLLKNPPFVILDEATSSVDTITEKKIQKALENLSKKRTVLIIAHRLSTIKKADHIAVIENGNIIEKGSHEILIKENGYYAKLWEYQSDLIPHLQ